MQQIWLTQYWKSHKVIWVTLLCCYCLCTVIIGTAAAQSNAQPENSQAAAIADLRKRVQQLEGQLVDMQVILGTLESLARAPGTAPAVPAATQPALKAGPAREPDPWSDNTRSSQAPISGFGETTVRPGRAASSNTVVQQDLPQVSAAARKERGPQAVYEAAYGLLLQQDYRAAQLAFADFIQKHPKSALAGKAQYWLGETFYLQGQYKNAAAAFLKSYQTYATSSKAPDSLLKLAMSLDRLGQRGSACASLREISKKYPTSPQHLQRRAQQEIRRLRC